MDIDEALLNGAVEAARRALRRLDSDQVPAELQRVARYQDRRLPPPLRARLVAALDSYPWLRARARDELTGPEDSTAAAADPSVLYLDRPLGWEAALGDLDRARAADAAAEAAAGAAASVVELESRLAKTEELLEASRREAEELRRESATATASAATRWKRRAVSGERRATTAAAAAETARRELDDLQQAHAAATAETEMLVYRLRRERAQRARAEAAAAAKASGVGVLRGLALARHIDALARRGALPRETDDAAGTGGESAPPVMIPPGVRPDDAAVVGALLRRDEPWHLVVDGYNAAFLLDAAPLSELRRRLMLGLARLRRRAAPALDLTVVWDAAAGEAVTRRRDEVLEVFVVDVSADDAIVELVANRGLPTVVATNDRDLQERVAELGGGVIWARALVDWLAAP